MNKKEILPNDQLNIVTGGFDYCYSYSVDPETHPYDENSKQALRFDYEVYHFSDDEINILKNSSCNLNYSSKLCGYKSVCDSNGKELSINEINKLLRKG